MSDSFSDHHRIAVALERIACAVEQWVAAALGKPVGILIVPGTPHPREGIPPMTQPKVTLTKAGAGMKSGPAPKKLKAGDPVADFIFQDNQDATCTVFGTNSAGDQVDLSGVATLTVSSSDPATVAVDPPSGMVFTMHGLKVSTPGTPTQITATATWKDNSVGPFSFTLPVDTTAGGPTGIKIVVGPPVIRP